jgi:1-deoxy-D-xylulose-5-phosphate synthase
MRILNKLTDYRDLKDMSRGALDFLCQDIREEIIRVVTKNGGHLASSLGAVELIVALLRQFNPLEDRIIFDVGHQAYAAFPSVKKAPVTISTLDIAVLPYPLP